MLQTLYDYYAYFESYYCFYYCHSRYYCCYYSYSPTSAATTPTPGVRYQSVRTRADAQHYDVVRNARQVPCRF